jgi:peptidoglycan-N-acetylglucosamine deacetylase
MAIENGRLVTGKIAQGRHIVFTFDDGPSYKTTPRIIDYLDKYQIKGVFFVNGRRFAGKSPIAKRNRAVLAELHRRKHYIANHTWSHPNMASISGKVQTRQILKNEYIIKSVTGYKTRLYRPPFGQKTRFSTSFLQRLGYTIVMWNIDANDPFERHAGKNYSNVLKDIYNFSRGMVLMHDTNVWSIEAVPRIIKSVYLWNCELSARGEPQYEFATMREFYIPIDGSNAEPTLEMLKKAKGRKDRMAAWCSNLSRGAKK